MEGHQQRQGKNPKKLPKRANFEDHRNFFLKFQVDSAPMVTKKIARTIYGHAAEIGLIFD
jgi:hypothetical protein